jgi:hypothetical protein
MDASVVKHTRRLRVIFLGFVVSLAAYAGIVLFLPGPAEATLPQAEALLWGFAFVAAVNLVTIMPTYRAMLARPRRVFAVGRQPERLLAAHSAAHVLALARVEFVAILGLLLYFLTGRRDWFWTLLAVAAVGTALLWPRRCKVAVLLEVHDEEGAPILAR